MDSLVSAPRWIAQKNYVELFTTDRFFLKAWSNTGIFALGTVLPGLALAMVFAVLLNQDIRGRFVYRAIYFVPVVAIALGVTLRDEPLHAAALLGTGLVLAGAYMTSRR